MIPTLHQDAIYRLSSVPIHFVRESALLRANTSVIVVNIITVDIRYRVKVSNISGL